MNETETIPQSLRDLMQERQWNEIEVMNRLQNYGLVSDNAAMLKDCCFSDLSKAMTVDSWKE